MVWNRGKNFFAGKGPKGRQYKKTTVQIGKPYTPLRSRRHKGGTRSNAVVRVRRAVCPAQMVIPLKYVSATYQIVCTSGVSQTHLFNFNDIYDPDRTVILSYNSTVVIVALKHRYSKPITVLGINP